MFYRYDCCSVHVDGIYTINLVIFCKKYILVIIMHLKVDKKKNSAKLQVN